MVDTIFKAIILLVIVVICFYAIRRRHKAYMKYVNKWYNRKVENDNDSKYT